MSDSYVQTLPDSTGKKIDTTELTDDALNVVERQRVVEAVDKDSQVSAVIIRV